MGWGILIITFIGLFIGFVICQEMFAQRHWRGLVANGDRWAIQTLVEAEIDRWRGMRVPKGTNALLWHGIQTAEVASVGRDFINLTASAEGETRAAGGARHEVSSPLEEGMKLAAALIERLFYDVPNVRLDVIRVDVYTTFRAADGTPEQKCILSVLAERADADALPWDDLLPHEIVNRFEANYLPSEHGAALPIDPDPPLRDTEIEGLGPDAGFDSHPPSRNGSSAHDRTVTG